METYLDRLAELGVPEVIFRSEQAWLYFVDHLYDRENPELLNLDRWPVEKLERLLPVFQEMHDAGAYAGGMSGVLSWLKGRTANT